MAYTLYDTASKACSWSGSYSGFMNVSISFTLNVTLNNDPSNDSAPWQTVSTISNFTETHDWGTVSGGGFINVGGIAWGPAIGQSAELLSDGTLDTYDLMISQRNAAFGSAYDFNLKNVWGIYASDEGSPPATSGVWQGSAPSWTQTYATSPFEQDIYIISPYQRYYDWQNEPNTAYFNAGGAFYVTFKDLFPDYIPWNRRLTSWQACNRSGGDMARRESGAWVTMHNRTNTTDTGVNDGFRRVSSAWRPSPLMT